MQLRALRDGLFKGSPNKHAPDADHAPPARPWLNHASMSLLALTLLLCVSAIFFIGLGPVHVSPLETCAILLDRVGISLHVPFTEAQASVIWTLRLPRALLAAMVGGMLGMAGATLQGLFRSPLADPGLMGVSSGASLAAVGTLALGHKLPPALEHITSSYALPVAGVAGAFVALMGVYTLSQLRGRAMVTTMLLGGLAINGFASAALGVVTYVATHAQVRELTFWTLGSLGHAGWYPVLCTVPVAVAGCFVVLKLSRALNATVLGYSEAAHLGFDLAKTRLWAMAFAALAVGTSVTLAGTVSFVGLVAPTLSRLVLGGDHRVALPGAALLGAGLVLWVDVLSRTWAAPAEIPIGLLTALVGAPVFLWLVYSERSRLGA